MRSALKGINLLTGANLLKTLLLLKREAKLNNDRVVPMNMGPYLHTVYLSETFSIRNLSVHV